MNFPIHNLDLSKYVKSKDASESSHVYELYAISNHYGGLGGGHYTAYCKVLSNSSCPLVEYLQKSSCSPEYIPLEQAINWEQLIV